MKKLILSICITTLFIGAVQAQETSTARNLSKFRFGLYVSGGISTLKPASATTTTTQKYAVVKGKSKASFGFGLNAEKPLTNKYALVTGVGLDWQGGAITATKDTSVTGADYVSSNLAYKLKYIQIPVGLKLKATNIKKFQIYGQVGLDASILIGNKANGTIGAVAVAGSSQKRTLAPLTLGMDLGLGTEFKVSEDNSAYVALMYRNGFTDATAPKLRPSADKTWQDGNVRANNIALRIGYFF